MSKVVYIDKYREKKVDEEKAFKRAEALIFKVRRRKPKKI